MTRLAARLSSRIVILAAGGARSTAEYLGVSPEKLVAIGNGVRSGIELTPPADPPLLPRPVGNERWIGYVGTFYDWQGVEVLADALPHAFAHDPRLRAVLVGDGPAKAGVVTRLAAAGVMDRVRLEPAVPWSRVAQYTREIDLFTMLRPAELSTETVLPLKILEVALLGSPLLISNRAALLDVARPDPETKVFVQADLSPESVGLRLAQILAEGNDAGRRAMAARFKDHVAKGGYSWDRSAEQLLGIYRASLAERGG